MCAYRFTEALKAIVVAAVWSIVVVVPEPVDLVCGGGLCWCRCCCCPACHLGGMEV